MSLYRTDDKDQMIVQGAVEMEKSIHSTVNPPYSRLVGFMGLPREVLQSEWGRRMYENGGWMEAVEVAMRNTTEVYVTGSAVTYGERSDQGRSEFEHFVPKAVEKILSGRVKQENGPSYEPNTVVSEYLQGKIDIGGLSGGGYTLLHQILNMQYANLDIVIYPKLGNVTDMSVMIAALMRYQDTYFTDGGWRGMAKVGWYGKDFLNRVMVYDQGGMGLTNIMVMDPAMREQDEWLRATNWREMQMQRVGYERVNGEKVLVLHKEKDLVAEKVKLLKKCKDRGELEHHKARIVRAMVMHGEDEARLDESSFTAQEDEAPGEWSYEDWMGVVNNLMPAMMKDGEKTRALMERMGMGVASEAESEWAREWFDNGAKELFEDAPEMEEFVSYIRQVLPDLSQGKVEVLVPQPDQRETVEYLPTGDRVRGTALASPVATGAWTALRMMAWEMSLSPDPRVREEATIVREKAWQVFDKGL